MMEQQQQQDHSGMNGGPGPGGDFQSQYPQAMQYQQGYSGKATPNQMLQQQTQSPGGQRGPTPQQQQQQQQQYRPQMGYADPRMRMMQPGGYGYPPQPAQGYPPMQPPSGYDPSQQQQQQQYPGYQQPHYPQPQQQQGMYGQPQQQGYMRPPYGQPYPGQQQQQQPYPPQQPYGYPYQQGPPPPPPPQVPKDDQGGASAPDGNGPALMSPDQPQPPPPPPPQPHDPQQQQHQQYQQYMMQQQQQQFYNQQRGYQPYPHPQQQQQQQQPGAAGPYPPRPNFPGYPGFPDQQPQPQQQQQAPPQPSQPWPPLPPPSGAVGSPYQPRAPNTGQQAPPPQSFSMSQQGPSQQPPPPVTPGAAMSTRPQTPGPGQQPPRLPFSANTNTSSVNSNSLSSGQQQPFFQQPPFAQQHSDNIKESLMTGDSSSVLSSSTSNNNNNTGNNQQQPDFPSPPNSRSQFPPTVNRQQFGSMSSIASAHGGPNNQGGDTASQSEDESGLVNRRRPMSPGSPASPSGSCPDESGDGGPLSPTSSSTKLSSSKAKLKKTSSVNNSGFGSGFGSGQEEKEKPLYPAPPCPPGLTPCMQPPLPHPVEPFDQQYSLGTEQDRKPFLDALYHYYANELKIHLFAPVVCKQVLDLFRLYVTVKDMGGFWEVNTSKRWKEVATAVITNTSASTGYTLRRFYVKCLLHYELQASGQGDPNAGVAEAERMFEQASKKEKRRKENKEAKREAERLAQQQQQQQQQHGGPLKTEPPPTPTQPASQPPFPAPNVPQPGQPGVPPPGLMGAGPNAPMPPQQGPMMGGGYQTPTGYPPGAYPGQGYPGQPGGGMVPPGYPPQPGQGPAGYPGQPTAPGYPTPPRPQQQPGYPGQPGPYPGAPYPGQQPPQQPQITGYDAYGRPIYGPPQPQQQTGMYPPPGQQQPGYPGGPMQPPPHGYPTQQPPMGPPVPGQDGQQPQQDPQQPYPGHMAAQGPRPGYPQQYPGQGYPPSMGGPRPPYPGQQMPGPDGQQMPMGQQPQQPGMMPGGGGYPNPNLSAMSQQQQQLFMQQQQQRAAMIHHHQQQQQQMMGQAPGQMMPPHMGQQMPPMSQQQVQQQPPQQPDFQSSQQQPGGSMTPGPGSASKPPGSSPPASGKGKRGKGKKNQQQQQQQQMNDSSLLGDDSMGPAGGNNNSSFQFPELESPATATPPRKGKGKKRDQQQQQQQQQLQQQQLQIQPSGPLAGILAGPPNNQTNQQPPSQLSSLLAQAPMTGPNGPSMGPPMVPPSASSMLMMPTTVTALPIVQPSPFPMGCVEALQPFTVKRRKMTARDLGPVDPWRVVMSLKTSLVADQNWAIDVLHVLLADDHAAGYFTLNCWPYLLDMLCDIFRSNLALMMDDCLGDLIHSWDKISASTSNIICKQEPQSRCQSAMGEDTLNNSSRNVTFNDDVDDGEGDDELVLLSEKLAATCPKNGLNGTSKNIWGGGSHALLMLLKAKAADVKNEDRQIVLNGPKRKNYTWQTRKGVKVKIEDEHGEHHDDVSFLQQTNSNGKHSLANQMNNVNSSTLKKMNNSNLSKKSSSPLKIAPLSSRNGTPALTNGNGHLTNGHHESNGHHLIDESSNMSSCSHHSISSTSSNANNGNTSHQSASNRQPLQSKNNCIDSYVEVNLRPSDEWDLTKKLTTPSAKNLKLGTTGCPLSAFYMTAPYRSSYLRKKALQTALKKQRKTTRVAGSSVASKRTSPIELEMPVQEKCSKRVSESPSESSGLLMPVNLASKNGRKSKTPEPTTTSRTATPMAVDDGAEAVKVEAICVDTSAAADETKAQTPAVPPSPLRMPSPDLPTLIASKVKSEVAETLAGPSFLPRQSLMAPLEAEMLECERVLADRCVALSNIFRNLSAIPGNEAPMAKCWPLMAIFNRLLALRRHPEPSSAEKSSQRKFFSNSVVKAEKIDGLTVCLDDAVSVSSTTPSPTSPHLHDEGQQEELAASQPWWLPVLGQLHENVLVILANLASEFEFAQMPDEIARPLCLNLFAWYTGESSECTDAFPDQPDPMITPQRLALETLCKLTVRPGNVDHLIAAPPFGQLVASLWTALANLAQAPDQVLRELVVVFLAALAQADQGIARCLAMNPMAVVLLVTFLEQTEAQCAQAYNANPNHWTSTSIEAMGISCDILNRAALILLSMARIEENRSRFRRFDDRLLHLSMSRVLDRQVLQTLAEIIFELDRNVISAASIVAANAAANASSSKSNQVSPAIQQQQQQQVSVR